MKEIKGKYSLLNSELIPCCRVHLNDPSHYIAYIISSIDVTVNLALLAIFCIPIKYHQAFVV